MPKNPGNRSDLKRQVRRLEDSIIEIWRTYNLIIEDGGDLTHSLEPAIYEAIKRVPKHRYQSLESDQ